MILGKIDPLTGDSKNKTLPVATSPIALTAGEDIPFHCDYYKNKLCRAFWRLSYEGGAKYKDGKDASGEEVFIKHEQESQKGVKRRKRLSVYRNYCKPIVNKYNDFIFTQPIKREDENEIYLEWCLDVDNLGTSLHHYMRELSRIAAVEGTAYTLIESTKEDPEQTQAQSLIAGNRLFLVTIDNDRIINWTESSGVMTQVLVYFPQYNELRLYEKDTITRAFIDSKDRMKIKIVDEPMKHPYGILPVVRVESMPNCNSQIEDIAECNKSLYNMDALLREELARQTFTQWLVTGVDAEDMMKAEAVLGGRKLWCINKQGIEAKQLGSDISQAESIRKTIDGDIREIYRLSGLQNPEVVQGAESGRALKIRWNDVAITAGAIADNAEHSENKIIELWTAGMGGAQEITPSDYPENFDTESLEISLKMTLDILASDLPPIVKNLKTREFTNEAFPKMTYEEKQLLESQLKEKEQYEQENRNALQMLKAGEPAVNEEEDDTWKR